MSPSLRLDDILRAIEVPAKVTRRSEVRVERAASLASAGPDAVAFCAKVGEEALMAIASTRASVVLARDDIDSERLPPDAPAVILVENPRLAFIKLMRRHFEPTPRFGIDPTARIHSSAIVDDDVFIGPYVTIGARCRVGASTVLHPHVVLYDDVRIGRRVTIHAGTVVGAAGFGYERNPDGTLEGFPHVGGVVIEDDVEIGSNASIDRGTLDDTVIRSGARIDNLVHIAHNVVVGRDAVVIAHAMVGGGVVIGEQAWVAPSAAIRQALRIGEGATLGLGAVVVKDVPARATWMGSPARDAAEFKLMNARLTQLAKEAADPS